MQTVNAPSDFTPLSPSHSHMEGENNLPPPTGLKPGTRWGRAEVGGHNPFLPWTFFLLAVVARLVPGPRTIDDAFITFRYARNLVTGLGFVYNPGERVLGTTTPLYTLLLAGLARLLNSDNYPSLALILNATLEGLSVVLLYHLGRMLSGSRLFGAALGLLWAVAPMGVTFAIGGMETALVTFLLIATFYAHIVQRPRLSALLGGLATLTRPDALLAPALVLLDKMLRRPSDDERCMTDDECASFTLRPLSFVLRLLQRVPWAEVAVFLAVIAPWLAFATWYFGSPLGQSIVAKAVAYHLPRRAALVSWLQTLSVPFFEHETIPAYPGFIGFIVYLTLYLIGARRLVRRSPHSLPLFLYPALYVSVYVAANPLIFRWYWAPPLPFYFLGILAGVWAILSDLPARFQRASGPAFAVIAALLLGLSLHGWTLHPDHGPNRPTPRMAFIRLEALYARVAESLKAQGQAQGLPLHSQTIAAGDIGVLGYATGARILDTLGLVSPEASRYYPLPSEAYVGNYAVAPALIAAARPDVIVILEVYGRKTLLTDPAFQASYRLVQRWDDPVVNELYRSEGLLVFVRRQAGE